MYQDGLLLSWRSRWFSQSTVEIELLLKRLMTMTLRPAEHHPHSLADQLPLAGAAVYFVDVKNGDNLQQKRSCTSV